MKGDTIKMNKQRKVLSEFTYENKKFKLVQPTVKIMKEAKHRHTKVFTNCLKEGFYTKRKLEAQLSDGDFDVIQDHLTRRGEILKLFTETQSQLDLSEDPAEIDYLAELLSLYRSSLVQEDNSMNVVYSNTADQMSEDERLNFLMYSLIKNEDLSNVWDSYSDFEEDPDFDFTEQCRYQLMCWEYSLNPNWEENLPETEAKKKANVIREKQLKESEEDNAVGENKKESPKKTVNKKENIKKKSTKEKKGTKPKKKSIKGKPSGKEKVKEKEETTE